MVTRPAGGLHAGHAEVEAGEPRGDPLAEEAPHQSAHQHVRHKPTCQAGIPGYAQNQRGNLDTKGVLEDLNRHNLVGLGA